MKHNAVEIDSDSWCLDELWCRLEEPKQAFPSVFTILKLENIT